MKKRAQTTGLMLDIIIFLFIILLLVLSLYLLYLNLPGEPEVLKVKVNRSQIINYSDELQFYPKMKFNHNEISYRIDPSCDQFKKARVKRALKELSQLVGYINFIQTNEKPDITITCKPEENERSFGHYFIAGEGGAKRIIPTGEYNVIEEGVIYLYGERYSQSIKCKYPTVELHELLHVFGFRHSPNKHDLMFPVLSSCQQRINTEIIKKLKELYSEENSADLTFEKIYAVKKGIYLDFNVTIKNQGDTTAENIEWIVKSDGKVVKNFEIKKLNYGAKIVIEVQNLKLNSRNPKKIEFVIDPQHKIKEKNKENNYGKIEFL